MTYNERLNDLATEMTKEHCQDFDTLNARKQIGWRNIYLPLARIALKHMAEAYAAGNEQGTLFPNSDIDLVEIGLIEPQTEKV